MKTSKVAKELSRELPDRIKQLSGMIARKPAHFTSNWAKSIKESFNLYTRTSTINLFQSINDVLIEAEWPLPSYIDLKDTIPNQIKLVLLMPNFLVLAKELGQDESFNFEMSKLFRKYSKQVFANFKENLLLKSQGRIIAEIERAYRLKMWAVCITSIFPLLDLVARSYFKTDNLRVSIQELEQAFTLADIKPVDLKPGFSIHERQQDFGQKDVLISSPEEDLRLLGIYLSSFLEFAKRYYGWYTSTSSKPSSKLNRHAIIHCASECWTESNVVRLLMFLDLTIQLEDVFKILIHGEIELTSLSKG